MLFSVGESLVKITALASSENIFMAILIENLCVASMDVCTSFFCKKFIELFSWGKKGLCYLP